MRFAALLPMALAVVPACADACDTALVLAIDVSNSIDPAEYRLQTDGMADALRDPDIIAAMIEGEVAIAVVQWSGADKQALSIPWTRVRSTLDAQVLSNRARRVERAFVLSDTAPAEAINFSLGLFGDVTDCERHVIDISGDGTPNGGGSVEFSRVAAERAGVTINAIAIESMGLAITNFYNGTVITHDGFVMTARTHRTYPEAIRAKILREVSKVIS